MFGMIQSETCTIEVIIIIAKNENKRYPYFTLKANLLIKQLCIKIKNPHVKTAHLNARKTTSKNAIISKDKVSKNINLKLSASVSLSLIVLWGLFKSCRLLFINFLYIFLSHTQHPRQKEECEAATLLHLRTYQMRSDNPLL